MSILVSLLIAVLVFGLLWWVIKLLPIDPKIRQVAYVILVIIAVVWLLNLLGVFTGIAVTG